MNKISGKIFLYPTFASFFWICFLIILPFVFSTQLLDEDKLPKLVLISSIMIILAIRSILIPSFRQIDQSVAIITLLITLYFIYAFALADNYSSGLSSLVTLLLPFFLIILMRANKLFKTELIYFCLPVAAIILCVYALSQYILMPGKNFQPTYLIRATMSNKNFLSEALVIYLIISVSGFINTVGMLKKLNFSSLVLIIITILLLQTLSVYICLLFLAIIVLPLFILRFRVINFKRKFLLVYMVPGLLICTTALIIGFRSPIFKSAKEKIEYSVNIVSGKPLPVANDGRQNSIYERLYLWKNSLKLFSESPITGIGLSNWQIYWPKYGMQGASYLDAAIMRYEHPHNEYLLLITESGIAGILLYALFFILIMITGIRFVFSKLKVSGKQTVFLMLSGLVCVGILAFFGYPLQRPYTITLCMLLCYIILETSDNDHPQKKISYKLPVIFILLFSIFSLNLFANRLKGEYYLYKAFKNQSTGNFSGMLRMIRKAENKYFTLDNSSTPLNWYKGFSMFYQGNDSAMHYYQLAELQNPYHVQTLSDIGALLENQGKHQESIQYFNKVLSFVPGYYHAHYNLAVAYFNLGKPAEALKEINARSNIGEEYQNTLDVILARNAEIAADSCSASENLRLLISDKNLLRAINKTSLEQGIAFREIFCDTINERE